MINKIGEDYFKSQKISESFQYALKNNSRHKVGNLNPQQMVEGINREGVKKSSPDDVVRQNETKTAGGNDVLRYFSKAAGLKRENSSPVRKAPEEPAKFRIDTKDSIKMSAEGREELKSQNENEYDAFRYKNPLNMTAFCQNLGLETKESSGNNPGGSLADRLKAISINSVGMAW